MKIAVASGKGGTGKTTLSCAMAFAAQEKVTLLDCDVEEPNSHFFIRPEIEHQEQVFRPVPAVDETKCTGCGECARVCQFNAIVTVNGKTLVFNELCHSCGACVRICPTGALHEVDQPIGQIETGRRDHVRFVSGRLDVGQAMSPPLIRRTLEQADAESLTIVDCPPGTSCPYVTAVKACDAALLVTEPTPFGLHDLKLAVETIRDLGVPFGVAVNRMTEEKNPIQAYCEAEGIPLLIQIPEDRRAAEAYSRGEPINTVMPELNERLAQIPEQLKAMI
ncbi:ATP-binding protein [Pontiella agarivorans]|uniref:ATP-binding protein n=1 Tax=Pontiella agarivorans TaxID=3038953 RepID=A0ABU5MUV8_9BACT|nr:ATP-binding protein [Pontiella agarivorans]MDZ8118004.1 ATP-binding protein [Pontiella agarivorans]